MTHALLHGAQYLRDALLLRVGDEAAHGAPDERLDAAVVGRVVEQHGGAAELQQEAQGLQAHTLRAGRTERLQRIQHLFVLSLILCLNTIRTWSTYQSTK